VISRQQVQHERILTYAGVAYQLIEDDPLVDTEQCERDATLMQQLGANAIRVYHVNETADHTGCMNVFAARGIYVFVDLDSFKTYIRYVRQSDMPHDT
jgi:1,3-beta-glucanosyltransferase GAS1